MCNLGMAIEMKGMEKGLEKGLLSSIEKLMKTMKWTVQQAMDALEVPESEQPHYAALIGS